MKKKMKMKMNTEQKAKAYDEAKARISRACNDNRCTLGFMNEIFSKPKEGEDERIRKQILSFLKEFEYDHYRNIDFSSWIAWLEKQKPFTDEEYNQGKEDVLWCIKKAKEQAKDENEMGTIWLAEKWLEKQGKKSFRERYDRIKESELFKKTHAGMSVSDDGSFDDGNEVEPKFRYGQWIVWQDKCYKVNYNGCGYELVDQNGLSTSLEYGTVEESAHIWEITKDAKDGDVLANDKSIFIFQEEYIAEKPIAYCGLMNGRFIKGEDACWTNEKCYPATKEQRDILMKAIADAGFTFAFEKKELKKIEDEEYDGEDYGIDSLWHAKNILEKTLGKVNGYQTDDGILEHHILGGSCSSIESLKYSVAREVAEKLTDAFIEKACWWLQSHTMKELCMKEEDNELVQEFIESFKDYMKGE